MFIDALYNIFSAYVNLIYNAKNNLLNIKLIWLLNIT